MSSAQIKTYLRAARENIKTKHYSKALDLAKKVLTYEPANYTAHVFAGTCLFNLSQFPDSEKSYREAVSLNSTNPLAWQGLLKLYERQGNLPGLKEASLALADIYLQRHPSHQKLVNITLAMTKNIVSM